MSGPPPISPDRYLELFDVPSEVILSALGTNYNTVVRSWLLKQYQDQLDYHKSMVRYYKTVINKLDGYDIRYENEPEATPVSPAAANGGPIKLSDLAKQRPAATTGQVTVYSQDFVKKEKKKEEKPAIPGHAGNIALSTSLASNEVKFDKKPTKVTITVEEDQDNANQNLTHFTRPQVKRANNTRTDIKNTEIVKQDKEDGDVETWQEAPGAFADLKKESKFKATFGNLKSSLFKEKEDGIQSNNTGPISPTTTTTTTTTTQPTSPQFGSYNQTNNYSSNPSSNASTSYTYSSTGPASAINNSNNYGTHTNYGTSSNNYGTNSNNYGTSSNNYNTNNNYTTNYGGDNNTAPSYNTSSSTVKHNIPPAPPTPSGSGGPPLLIPRPPNSALHSTAASNLPIPPPPPTP